MMELSITTAFIPFTLARRIGIWIAPRIVLPTLALGVAADVAIVGIILSWQAQVALDFRPRSRCDAGRTPPQPRSTAL